MIHTALSNGADEEVYMKIGTEWSDDDVSFDILLDLYAQAIGGFGVFNKTT